MSVGDFTKIVFFILHFATPKKTYNEITFKLLNKKPPQKQRFEKFMLITKG